MKKRADENDDIPAEIDFSRGVRGSFAGRVAPGASLVVIEPELSRVFPSAEAVNQALRVIAAASKALVPINHASAEDTELPSGAVKTRGRRKAS